MRKYLLVLSLGLFFASCCDDDPVQNETSNYFPLNIGNYWVYENYEIDTLGFQTQEHVLDSIYIDRDTMINNLQYFIVEGSRFLYSGNLVGFFRDSSGYLVNERGEIRFSESNFNDILASSDFPGGLIQTTYKMEMTPNTIVVPAGEFEALNFQGTITANQPINGIEYPRIVNNY